MTGFMYTFLLVTGGVRDIPLSMHSSLCSMENLAKKSHVYVVLVITKDHMAMSRIEKLVAEKENKCIVYCLVMSYFSDTDFQTTKNHLTTINVWRTCFVCSRVVFLHLAWSENQSRRGQRKNL